MSGYRTHLKITEKRRRGTICFPYQPKWHWLTIHTRFVWED